MTPLFLTTIGRTGKLIFCVFENHLDTHKIPLSVQEYVFLKRLQDLPGSQITQQEMAALLKKDKSVIMRRTASLEQKGLICCSKGTLDKRTKSVVLTPWGESMLEKASGIEQQLSNDLSVVCTAAELETLQSVLNRMAHFITRGFLR